MAGAEPELETLKTLSLQWLIVTNQKQDDLTGEQFPYLAHHVSVIVYFEEILSIHEVLVVAAPDMNSDYYFCLLSAALDQCGYVVPNSWIGFKETPNGFCVLLKCS